MLNVFSGYTLGFFRWWKGETSTLSTTKESLQELILMVHNHGQTCPLPPVLHSATVKKTTEQDQKLSCSRDKRSWNWVQRLIWGGCVSQYTCENGHLFLWSPLKKVMTSKNQGGRTAFSPKRLKQQGRRQLKEPDTDIERQEVVTRLKTRQKQQQQNAEVTTNDTEQKHKTRSEMFRENKNAGDCF